MERVIINYAGRTVDLVPAPVKVYDLFGGGMARFGADEVQAVQSEKTPAEYLGTKTLWVRVYLFNGHIFEVKSKYEEELLGYVRGT